MLANIRALVTVRDRRFKRCEGAIRGVTSW